MGSFGDKLKRERELRGVTLEEIAKATKIGTRALKALEDEHFEQLPGGIFNKGFVRAYAKFLGLDEEQMVADFMAAQGDRDAQKPDLMASLAVKAEAQRRSEIAASGGEKSGSSSTWVTLAVLVLVTAGAAAGVRYYKMRKEAKAAAVRTLVVVPAQQPVTPVTTPTNANLSSAPVNSATADPNAAPGTSAAGVATGQTPGATQGTVSPAGGVTGSASSPPTVPASSATPSGAGGTAMSAKPANVTKAPIELQIHVSKATWLSVQADGKPEVAETLRDSATKTIVGQEKIVITTGNSVDVTCNGKPLGILGTDNQRSQVKISADCKVN